MDGLQRINRFQVDGHPYAVCVDLRGWVVVSSDQHEIQFYEPRMNYRLVHVLRGTGGSDGEGGDQPQLKSRLSRNRHHITSQKAGPTHERFCHPLGVCVDDVNTLIVADSNNHRVLFFSF